MRYIARLDPAKMAPRESEFNFQKRAGDLALKWDQILKPNKLANGSPVGSAVCSQRTNGNVVADKEEEKDKADCKGNEESGSS